MGFSRPEYWSGLPFPSPADLPEQGSNPGLLQILYHLSHPGKPKGSREGSSLFLLKLWSGNYTATWTQAKSQSSGGRFRHRKIKYQIINNEWKAKGGTSLAVQWPSLCSPSAGPPGSIPGQRTRFHLLQPRAWTLQLKTPRAAVGTGEPLCCNWDPLRPKETSQYVHLPRPKETPCYWILSSSETSNLKNE